MKEKLLTVVYNDDIPQFEMLCHCLAKNWQGNKHLTVVVGKPNPATVHLPGNIETVRSIVKEKFNHNWAVEVVDGAIGTLHGYQEQQLNKIRFSLNDADCTIVLDSKDFLLKPGNLSDFYQDDVYRIGYFHSNRLFLDFYPDVAKVVDNISPNTPTSFFATPWIWEEQQLSKFWTYLQARYGQYTSWTEMPGSSEWAAFFAYTFNDPMSTMKLSSNEYAYVMFGGVWNDQTVQGALEQLSEFWRWPERKFWKHTRKVFDPFLVVVTVAALQQAGIEQAAILKWANAVLARMPNIDITN